MPEVRHEAGLHPPSAHGAQPAGRADAAPLTNPAHHTDASAPGKAPPRGPPETRAKSEARETTLKKPQLAADRKTSPSGHNRDEDSLDAFMESCMSEPHAVPTPAAPRFRPEPRRDYAEGTPLTPSREAHLQRTYDALGQTGHANATDDGPATASGAGDQAPDEPGAPGSGTRVEAGTNTASKPTGPPPGTAPPWGRGHLAYARLGGDARHPSDHAEQAAAQDLGMWIHRFTIGEQLALAGSIRWLFTSQSRHLGEGTRTMADITFGHATGHTPPATMDHPGQWHYVATELMAHMGGYSPDEMNGLHWQWYQRAALRIPAAMQRHNIWDIPGSPGYQGHASGHQRPQSQDIPEPPREAARRNSPERQRGPPPGMDSSSGRYRSPLQPFAPQRGQGSPHTSEMQGGTPEQHQETRKNPNCSRRRSRTPPPAARCVVFHEDTDRGRGGPNNLHAQRTPSTTDPRRRSKRPRNEQPHIPTILCQPSKSDRQRFTRARPGQQTERPAYPPRPSQGRRPAPCRGDSTPRTHGQGNPRPTKGLHKGWGDSPPHNPPRSGAR